jgi:hypothetical protein
MRLPKSRESCLRADGEREAQQLGVLAKKFLPRGVPDASRQGLQRMPTCQGNNEDSRREARMKSSIASMFAAVVCSQSVV